MRYWYEGLFSSWISSEYNNSNQLFENVTIFQFMSNFILLLFLIWLFDALTWHNYVRAYFADISAGLHWQYLYSYVGTNTLEGAFELSETGSAIEASLVDPLPDRELKLVLLWLYHQLRSYKNDGTICWYALFLVSFYAAVLTLLRQSYLWKPCISILCCWLTVECSLVVSHQVNPWCIIIMKTYGRTTNQYF